MPAGFLPPATQPRSSTIQNEFACKRREEDSIHRTRSIKTLPSFSYCAHSVAKSALILLIVKKYFLQMLIWELRVNANIESQTKKGAGFLEKHLRCWWDSVTATPGALTFLHLVSSMTSAVSSLSGTHGPTVMMGAGQSATFSQLGSRTGDGSAFIFVTTCKGDWKGLEVLMNIAPHILNLFHRLYSTGGQWA